MNRNEHLRALSLNHYDGLIIARRLRLGLEKEADASTMRNYALHQWTKHLKPHCEREEEHLLPELNRFTCTALKSRFLRDHEEMARVMVCVQLSDNPRPYLAQLADLLNDHIRFEERKLFPFLERQLGDERLSRIGRYLNDAHQDADKDWTPAFWQ